MTAPAVHDSFTIARTFPHSPARVFGAFSTEEAKRKWFAPPSPEWEFIERQFDFRVGGVETIEAKWESGKHSRMELVYHDIVPDRRIVYSYAMLLSGVKISVNLTTIELVASQGGTALTLTEYGAYLDGYEDNGSREHGVTLQIEKLGETL